MSSKKLLANAIARASTLHIDQFDRGGNPYILHPLQVMRWVSKHTDDPNVLIAAVLHDAVEDCDITLNEVREVFGDYVSFLVDLLTKKDGQSYNEYIGLIKLHRNASLIKMMDIRHNSDITRLKGITDKDFDRMHKYHKAYLELKEVVDFRR